MNINFFGDMVPIENVLLDDYIINADLSFINLEVPVTESNKHILKAGPVLKSCKKYLKNIIKQFNGYVYLNLSNNHMGDYGEQGIIDTINICKELNIYYGGVNINNKIEPTIINNKIAVISVCERQFGISQYNKIGVNYHTPNIYKEIYRLKKEKYKIIISSHVAEEMILWPSPSLQDYFRSLIDIGADIIYNTHSHVPQGFEIYKNKFIFYGLGNFIVDPYHWKSKKNTNWSIFFEVREDHFNYFGLKISEDHCVKIHDCNKDYIDDCNTPLNNRIMLNSIWQEYSLLIYEDIYKKWLRQDDIFIDINLKSFLIYALKSILKKRKVYCKKVSKSDIALWYHLFSCKSHRLAIETALGVKMGEINDLRNDYSKKILNKYYQK